MCQPVIQFCSGSTRPLLFAGGCLSLLLAIAIGYTGCTTNALFTDLDPQVAGAHQLLYYLQLAASGYLALITLFSCHAAYYDQKHSIRALAIITALNFVLALVAILMVPPSQEIGQQFAGTLKQAASKYDFTLRSPPGAQQPAPASSQLERLNSTAPLQASSGHNGSARQVRAADGPESQEAEHSAAGPGARAPAQVRELSAEEATRIWDQLQARGCCGLHNGTEDWRKHLPKSCCNEPLPDDMNWICREIDADHRQGCLTLIGSSSLNLLIVLSLIALVNFYLAIIAAISAYRTLHYDEASQSAYT